MILHQVRCDRKGCGAVGELLPSSSAGFNAEEVDEYYSMPEGWQRVPFVGHLCSACALELYRKTQTLQNEFINTEKEN